MLIRIVMENLLSFGERKEFNMLPSTRSTRHLHHKLPLGKSGVLKMAAIYGANGAGKTNLVKGIALLKEIVERGSIPPRMHQGAFKLNPKSAETPQMIACEFAVEGRSFMYGIQVLKNEIRTEELYETHFGSKEASLVFSREAGEEPVLEFSKTFSALGDFELRRRFYLKRLKPNSLLLGLLADMGEEIPEAELTLAWFQEILRVISPSSRYLGLHHSAELDKGFHHYLNEMIQAFHVGVSRFNTKRSPVEEYFGNDNTIELEKMLAALEASDQTSIDVRSKDGEVIRIFKEDGKYFVGTISLSHVCQDGSETEFSLAEESDGTKRLLDLAPIFYDSERRPQVYVIDEIERSIHPLMIKELIRKFSQDPETSTQILFTTHESNLLDQDIFRLDEIWFAEKRPDGQTDLYSLSDFKEHNTIDIQKGYLSGRYGSIPFLSNLRDLNWHLHETVH